MTDETRQTADLDDLRRRALAAIVHGLDLSPDCVNWDRLNRALIHRSYRTEADLDEDNERLEFLGDSVIGLAATEFLLRRFPDVDEGHLSKVRGALVSRAVLGEIAKSLDIGSLMLLGTGEERSGGRDRPSILGSALEAICGALYLSCPWPSLKASLERHIIVPGLELAERNFAVDFKSRLQEWSQHHFQCVPEYRVVEEGGPDHHKTFRVEVRIRDEVVAEGVGRRKKYAENDAARHALEIIDERSGFR